MQFKKKKKIMSHVATCFKETALLFNAHLICFVDFILCRTNTCSKVPIKNLD